MARTTRSVLALLLVAVVHGSERTQAAAPELEPLAARLVGHWSLVSFEAVTGGHSEYPFGRDALGQITYDALFNNDLFLLAGCIVGSSLLLVVGNLLADLANM